MRKGTLLRITALLAVLALTIPVMARPVTKSMTLSKPAKVGSAQLDTGDYRLTINDTQVTIQQGKEVVAEVQGRWEVRDEKSRYNSVLIGDNGQIKEIRFAGEKRVLILSN